jgi:hypothetical protein
MEVTVSKLETINEGHGRIWQINGINITLPNLAPEKSTPEAISEYVKAIYDCLYQKISFEILVKEVGITVVLKIAINLFHELTIDYITYFANQFTNEREKISINKMAIRIFGLETSNFKWSNELMAFKAEFETVIDNEYFRQCNVFIKDNQKEISLNKESWTLYWLRGPGLNCRTFDFTKIKCPTIRKEVMLHYKKKLWCETNYRDDRGIASVVKAMNFIYESNPSVKFCANITGGDVTKLLTFLEYHDKTQYQDDASPNAIRKTIQHCGLIIGHLMEYRGEKHPLSYPIPLSNPFNEVKFKNIAQMEKNTEIIPDIVFEQLKKYEHELSDVHQLLCKIFENTGMRADEVVELEEDCVRYIKEYEAWVLRYKVTKTMEARRKKSQSDYNIVVIPEDVSLLIMEQEDTTEELRKKYNIKNIFINNTISGRKHALTQANAFVFALNRLAERHQIINVDGTLWHFTSRQYRKKVAVDMIENNATPHELARQFAHADTRTGKKFYAEVRKMRTADLNHKYYEKKFNLIMGEDKLKLFSEEERKALYVDFCLNYREVELGVCTKHFSEEPCSKRSGKSNCATCKNLCTGEKYLPKWIRLRDTQKQVINELIRLYKNEGIADYEQYREYQRELFWYNVYQDIIIKIEDWKKVNMSEK